MNNFWNLVGFEYKKIIQRKTFWATIIVCTVCLVLTLFASISGGDFSHSMGSDMSQYEAMLMDKAIISSNAGEITPQLINQALLANQEMIANDDNYLFNDYGKHLKSDAYIKYVLPYESIVSLLNVVYEENHDNLSGNRLGMISLNQMKAIDALKYEDIIFFDDDIEKLTLTLLNNAIGITNKEIIKNTELVEQIKFPLYNDYYGGYEAYGNNAKGLSLFVLFGILIILAPLFSNEYEEKTADLILASKNGKTSLCKAKVFVAVTSSVILSIVVLGLAFIGFLVIFGTEGGNVNMQILDPSVTYPFTLSQVCGIHIISVVIAATFFASFIVFLSAKVEKRTFPVVVIGTALIILPMLSGSFFRTNPLLYDMSELFPSNAVEFGVSRNFIEVFGTIFTPFKFVWVVSAFLIIIFAYLSGHYFKNHQTK